jgi:hypothetical protein
LHEGSRKPFVCLASPNVKRQKIHADSFLCAPKSKYLQPFQAGS